MVHTSVVIAILAVVRASGLTTRRNIEVQYKPRASELTGVCGGEVAEPPNRHLFLSHMKDAGVLCIAGEGFQTRGESTAEMIRLAVRPPFQADTLRDFRNLKIFIHDGDGNTECGADLAFSVNMQKINRTVCKDVPLMIPDFTFVHWREAGLLPDYSGLVQKVHALGEKPAKNQKCGWAGNRNMHPQREDMITLVRRSRLFDFGKLMSGRKRLNNLVEFVLPEHTTGTNNGRISMDDQVKKWSCLIDVQGGGGAYSGRIPLLLHSGRVLLMVGRAEERPMDYVWYGKGGDLKEQLAAWTHYVPVKSDLTDFEKRVRWVTNPMNSKQVGEIAANGRRFAEEYLTLDYATKYLAKQLLAAAAAKTN